MSGLGWGERQLARRPPIALTSPEPAWMSVFDNVVYGQEINSSDGEVDILFPRIEFSDNSAGILSYQAVADTVLGSTWDYHPYIDVDGVYAFSWQIIVEDVTANNDYKFITRLYPAGRYPAYAQPLKDQTISSGSAIFSDPFLYIDRTLVLPIQVSQDTPPNEVILSATLIKTSAGTLVTVTYSAELWICYLGELSATTVTSGDDPGPPP